MRSVDVIVLGAGIAGISAALHLQARGRQVLLLDRGPAGEEASRGNAGVIARDGCIPHRLSASPLVLGAQALGLRPETHVSWRGLRHHLPWLRAFRDASASVGVSRYVRALAPVQAAAVGEHLALARAANALRFFRPTGLVKLHDARDAEAAELEAHFARIYGTDYSELSSVDLARLEPHLVARGLRAVYWPDGQSVSSPGGVTKAYARFFRERGGIIDTGDAQSLAGAQGTWSVRASRGVVEAGTVVVALGSWSADLLAPLGYEFPLAALRGYHLHLRPAAGAGLSRPVADMARGFVLSPMERGIRLTTGVELAPRDAPARPRQMAQALAAARQIFPLGSPVDAAPWLGARPCLPDSLPVIGPAPAHPGLWFCFGHADTGFALGPATGRLLAEMIAGETPFTDPEAFSARRFAAGWEMLRFA